MEIAGDKIVPVLKEAQRHCIEIAICNRTGAWTQEYYSIADIKVFSRGRGNVIVLMLSSTKNENWFSIDANTIHGLKFNKYMYMDGELVETVTVDALDATFHNVL